MTRTARTSRRPDLRWGAALAAGVVLALALLWGACSDPAGPSSAPSSMVIVGGADQQATVGSRLPEPLAVRVLDEETEPVANATVHFVIRSGGGSLSSAGALTDATGTARTTWTLGTSTAEPPVVQATVHAATGVLTALFHARAGPGAPAKLAGAAGDAQTGAVAEQLPTSLAARVTDGHGNPVPGVAVSWTATLGGGSLEPATSATDSAGVARTRWRLGTKSGGNAAAAAVAGIADSVRFHAIGAAGPVATVTLAPDSLDLAAGASRQLAASLADAYGNAITDRPVVWTSADPAVATVSSSGVAFGVYPGATMIRAEAEGRTGIARLATTPGTAPLPTLTSISPDTLRPGATATLTGTSFGTTSSTTVTVAGVPATVTQASPSQLVVTVPPAQAFPCAPAFAVPVGVRVGGVGQTISHALAAATPVALGPGASVLLEPAAARCVRLPDEGGGYMLSVANGAASAGAAGGFTLIGTAASSPTASGSLRPLSARVSAAVAAEGTRPVGGAAHLRRLARDGALLEAAEREGSAGGAAGARAVLAADASASTQASVQAALPAVGDTLSLRVPRIGSATPCSDFASVRARVTYVGPRAVVLEDVDAPLAGRSDSVYAAVAGEFESVDYPILQAGFGDPMAYDAQLGGTGHVMILLTPRANAEGDLYGFTFAGDFLDNGTCQESNRAEILYGIVPTDSAAGIVPSVPGALTAEGWRRVMRATLIHEAKHLTAYAEKLSLGAPAEEPWLEEATAMVAEEIWARQVFGYAAGGDIGFGSPLACELRPADAGCAGTPLVLDFHFSRLADYLAAAAVHSALGAVPPGDASFYGSAWSLLRWTIDQYAGSESDFLKALVQEPRRTGIANLEARAGHPFPEMLADWSLALALDDDAGLAPERPQLAFPSWNLPSVFAGLHAADPQRYPAAWPSAPQRVSFGAFGVTLDGLPGGTAALFDLSGVQTAAEFLQLRGPTGAPVPGAFRLEIVRLK